MARVTIDYGLNGVMVERLVGIELRIKVGLRVGVRTDFLK